MNQNDRDWESLSGSNIEHEPFTCSAGIAIPLVSFAIWQRLARVCISLQVRSTSLLQQNLLYSPRPLPILHTYAQEIVRVELQLICAYRRCPTVDLEIQESNCFMVLIDRILQMIILLEMVSPITVRSARVV